MIELIEEIPRVEIVATGPAVSRTLGELATQQAGIDLDALGRQLQGAALVVVVGKAEESLRNRSVARAAEGAGCWTLTWSLHPRLLPGLTALLDMVHSASNEGFSDLARLRNALSDPCTVGLGSGDSFRQAAVAALQDLAAQGRDPSRGGGLVVCLRGPQQVDPDEVGAVVEGLRQATGASALAPGYVVDDPPLRVVLLLSGAQQVPERA